MFEVAYRPLVSRRQFAAWMAALVFAAVLVDGIALAAGAIGYHYLEGLDWLDATLNASLVMTGNGPVHPPQTPGGKLFTILDAMLGVILFAAVIGVLLIPVFHRMLHGFHSLRRDRHEKDEHLLIGVGGIHPASRGGRT